MSVRRMKTSTLFSLHFTQMRARCWIIVKKTQHKCPCSATEASNLVCLYFVTSKLHLICKRDGITDKRTDGQTIRLLDAPGGPFRPGIKIYNVLNKKKELNLTQSYDENPYTNRKFNNQLTTQRRHQKRRIHNDCGPTLVQCTKKSYNRDTDVSFPDQMTNFTFTPQFQIII